jgi:hypothetical protein
MESAIDHRGMCPQRLVSSVPARTDILPSLAAIERRRRLGLNFDGKVFIA